MVFRSWFEIKRYYTKQKLEYSKREWLKPYIELNIQKRKEAKAKGDKFGDVFFKLMNNAFYGKTIENVYNRQDIELVNDVDRYIKVSKKN